MNPRMARLLRARAVAAVVAVTTGATLLTAVACSDRGQSSASTDSALAKDLALAGQQTVQPTFQDTALSPAPVAAPTARQTSPAPVKARVADRPKDASPRRERRTPERSEAARKPAPTPEPTPVAEAPIPLVTGPAPIHGEIGSGTSVGLTSGAKVCTSSSLPGDKIVATVDEAVTGTNGAVIPAGSSIVLEVVSVAAGQSAGGAQINLRVRSLVINDKLYPISATVAPTGQLEQTKVAGADPNSDKKKVIGGAIIGALLGQLIGHDTKGTIIGAATGAAAGAVVSKAGEKREGCLPSGSALRLTLTGPLIMS